MCRAICRCSIRRRSASRSPALADPETDIATLGRRDHRGERRSHDTSVNKVVAGFADPARPARALYFSKASVPWGDGPHYEHIGLYAYRRAALERFVALPRGVLEQRERLEQLRALEAGMRISVSLIDPARLGVQVDTPADLARARQLLDSFSRGRIGKQGRCDGRQQSPTFARRSLQRPADMLFRPGSHRLPGSPAPIPTSPAAGSFPR